MNDLKQFIKTLTERDVGFYCSHPDYGGNRTVHLTPEQLLDYVKDPVAYLAKLYGVSSQEYIEWHQSEYSVRCSAKTTAGKQCKHNVEGGNRVEPKAWVQMQGGYCSIHQ